MKGIWITVITGFLGSGKTTLLNRLLKHPAMSEAAVIVNEFGEIGIDFDLVKQSSENVIQLENGCLCCTVKGDLIDTFRDLHLQRQGGLLPKFNRVVIETTGIADPGPVLQIILTDPLVSTCYSLDGVVTTVDAVNGLDTLDRFPESVKQAAVADRIILTKEDLVEELGLGNTDALRARLRALNPAAPILAVRGGNIEPSELFGFGMFDFEAKHIDVKAWLNAEAYAAPPDDAALLKLQRSGNIEGEPQASVAQAYAAQGHTPQVVDHHHDPLIRSFVWLRDEPMTLDMLRLFLDGLAKEAGPDLLRVKGIVNVVERPDQPAVIQGAQLIFHSLDWLPAWPSDDRRTRIVFITRGIEQAYIEDTFALIERMAKRSTMAVGAS